MADLSYCAAQVRDFDNDRFLTALFAPANLRDPLMTLYAFNLELAKIRETVSEPLIGRMRLQFWRDAVGGIVEGAPPAHEIATALSQTVRAHNISKADLHALIDAREIDLDDVPPADIRATIVYAEATSSSVIAMALRVLGAGQGIGPRRAQKWACRVLTAQSRRAVFAAVKCGRRGPKTFS